MLSANPDDYKKEIPAFPLATIMPPKVIGGQPTFLIASGMSLRDYFAAKALEAISHTDLSLDEEHSHRTIERVTKNCYRLADEMLKARDL
jgi:hypothetical protein